MMQIKTFDCLFCSVHYVQGGRLFTSSGTMYYHGFNLTLCNTKNADLPVCVNNVTADSEVRSLQGIIYGSGLTPTLKVAQLFEVFCLLLKFRFDCFCECVCVCMCIR